jgi:hypothetical protein
MKMTISDDDFAFKMLVQAWQHKYLYEDVYCGLYLYIENLGYQPESEMNTVIEKFKQQLK